MITFHPYSELSPLLHQDLLAIRNIPEITKFTTQNRVISLDEHLQWVTQLPHTSTCYYWGVLDNDRLMGGIHITHLDTPFPLWGIFFAPDISPLTTSLVTAHFIDQIFSSLKLTTLGSAVHNDNTPAIRFNTRLGFIPKTDEKGSDFCLMSLTYDAWRDQKKGKILAPLFEKLRTTPLQEIPWKR